MLHMSVPARCVVHGESCRPSLPDAVVIIVITVLACVLSVRGLEPPSVMAVLGGAGAVAAGTLLALRGGSRRLGHMLTRIVSAVATP
jgi:hypothetical protein